MNVSCDTFYSASKSSTSSTKPVRITSHSSSMKPVRIGNHLSSMKPVRIVSHSSSSPRLCDPCFSGDHRKVLERHQPIRLAQFLKQSEKGHCAEENNIREQNSAVSVRKKSQPERITLPSSKNKSSAFARKQTDDKIVNRQPFCERNVRRNLNVAFGSSKIQQENVDNKTVSTRKGNDVNHSRSIKEDESFGRRKSRLMPPNTIKEKFLEMVHNKDEVLSKNPARGQRDTICIDKEAILSVQCRLKHMIDETESHVHDLKLMSKRLEGLLSRPTGSETATREEPACRNADVAKLQAAAHETNESAIRDDRNRVADYSGTASHEPEMQNVQLQPRLVREDNKINVTESSLPCKESQAEVCLSEHVSKDANTTDNCSEISNICVVRKENEDTNRDDKENIENNVLNLSLQNDLANDSLLALENELGIRHDNLNIIRTPLKVNVPNDTNSRDPYDEYMKLKSRASFLVTPDTVRFRSACKEDNTGALSKKDPYISNKVFAQIQNLYKDSPDDVHRRANSVSINGEIGESHLNL